MTTDSKQAGQDEVRRCKVDFVYKRCYVDKYGNFVDPRTPWDELLKYRHHGQHILASKQEKRVESVDRKSRREVRAEKIALERQSHTSQMESYDLQQMTNRRKISARKRIDKLATQNL